MRGLSGPARKRDFVPPEILRGWDVLLGLLAATWPPCEERACPPMRP